MGHLLASYFTILIYPFYYKLKNDYEKKSNFQMLKIQMLKIWRTLDSEQF